MTAALRSSIGRVRQTAWPIVLAAVAAGAAWALAHTVLGRPQPFFAPIAAVVALSAGIGGRGSQAIQMLAGVAVGVAVGEGLVLVLGRGAPQVAIAAAVAMLAMAVATTGPLPLIQSGASAVLVVALQSPSSGAGRLLDALIGGAVALTVSQILFPPSPVSLLKEAGSEALRSLGEGLRASARALAKEDPAAAQTALTHLRSDVQGAMSGLADAREKGGKIARRTLRGRREAKRLARLDARMGNLDLLSGSVLLLSRASCHLTQEEERAAAPEWLHTAILELAGGVGTLAEDVESGEARRLANEAAAAAARKVASGEGCGHSDPRVTLVVEGIRLAAVDVSRLAAPEVDGSETTA